MKKQLNARCVQNESWELNEWKYELSGRSAEWQREPTEDNLGNNKLKRITMRSNEWMSCLLTINARSVNS